MNQMEIFIFVIIVTIVFKYFPKYSLSNLSLVKIQHPRDIKLSKECIYVLDESNPCLHLFSYNHILQKSVISQGTGREVINPLYFFIDHLDNILISDPVSNSILIYSPQFQLFHKISVSNSPNGVTVDTQGRLIVVSQSDTNCLQIY